jgi:hypothetical protein
MSNIEVRQVLESVIDAICEIDQECRTLLNGVEHGLANVKLEFQDQLFQETNKKLTEEPLIAWLVRKTLIGPNVEVGWELPYPEKRTQCDLVIHLRDSVRLWLELKLAWKSWFNCVGAPTYSNRAYASYLDGRDRTHSLRHDFEKLRNANLPAGDHRAVCLIGFDCGNKPMDRDVATVVRQAQELAPWEAAAERHWPDRRCHDFQINVWSWLLHPLGK